MIRTFQDKFEKIDISKYSNDEKFYKNLWLKKYNIHVDKKTKEQLKNELKDKIIGKIKFF